MKTIAFDLMGNDNGVKAGVNSALDFVEKNLDFTFILVGDATEINKITKETERIKIIDCKKSVDSSGGLAAARDEETSMGVAINLVKNKKADVVISSGDSGIYLSMATLILKRIPGVARPAFMPIFPTIIENKKFLLLDAGANLDTNDKMLEQWAYLGNAFSKYVLGVQKPRVHIINIGTENYKGPENSRIANETLLKNKKINYKGFIEPRDLLYGNTDVAIIDGYGGNLVLKSIEGTALALVNLLKTSLKSKLKYKIGSLISKGALYKVKETLDYRNVGAAWILGLNSLAAKAHGGSDEKAYAGAFQQIAYALNNNAITKLKEAIEKNGA